jgi:methanol--5-hydroxybenzimidazolylcobamide Co-methyltransferase
MSSIASLSEHIPNKRVSLNGVRTYDALAIRSLDDFYFGHSPNPVSCGRGLTIGAETVIPEIKLAVPPIDVTIESWPGIQKQYREIISSVCKRAVALDVPGLLVEFEPPLELSLKLRWTAEIVRVIADELQTVAESYGLANALRLSPHDLRGHGSHPKMRKGRHWDNLLEVFNQAAGFGADLLAIESIGGKEVFDGALAAVDLRRMVYALGVLAPRDMTHLWQEIVDAGQRGRIVASGDSACAFANTAMAMTLNHTLPKTFAAVVRVASIPHGLVAYAMGAQGPSKACAYEGPYIKAITGVPISMEGRSSACDHLSSVGNISKAVCDCWSSEPISETQIPAALSSILSLENMAYDCRLMNIASQTKIGAQRLRDWLVESDAGKDPQAYVLRPDVVLRLSREIITQRSAYRQVRHGVLATIAELRRAYGAKELLLGAHDIGCLDTMWRQADTLPESEDDFICSMAGELSSVSYLPEEYGL